MIIVHPLTHFGFQTLGPLAPLISFTEEEEVLRMANDSNAGLAAYFYTKDLGRVSSVCCSQLEKLLVEAPTLQNLIVQPFVVVASFSLGVACVRGTGVWHGCRK